MKHLDITEQFFTCFDHDGSEPVTYFAPGRVNLIGEHTDYNGGFVLPCAIQYGTWLAIRIIDDPIIRFASENFAFRTEVSLSSAGIRIGKEWVNYPLGIIHEFTEQGIAIPGMELFFFGDIPHGAGLSSSASIEMVTAFALNDLLQAGFSILELVKLSQRAENLFVGVHCGIMDQFAVGFGEQDHALLLNCATLEYKPVPLHLDGISLVIANTNKQRTLAGSRYNERVEECREAVRFLRQTQDIDQLGQMSYMQFFKAQQCIPDEVIRSRARHVISENQRVLNAVATLNHADILQFGALMNASHESLRENYEVTGMELDVLVAEAQSINGVLGSRMTGAGFGGCTVSLVKTGILGFFMEKVGQAYQQKTGLTADFYVAEISAGVRKIS